MLTKLLRCFNENIIFLAFTGTENEQEHLKTIRENIQRFQRNRKMREGMIPGK